jgi:hypothetical protein
VKEKHFLVSSSDLWLFSDLPKLTVLHSTATGKKSSLIYSNEAAKQKKVKDLINHF